MSTRTAPTTHNGELREYSHREILEVMSALLAALFTTLISTTIVSTALPTIMGDLNGTQRQYTWVITISLLAMTVSTPVWGKLSDLFNKKVLTQIALVAFVAGSIVAGFSHTVFTLMAARAVQGLAMGGLMALAQAIMGTIMAPRQRGRYAGYMGAVMAVATVSGPLLGGVITDGIGWRWCFFVCVPLAVLALILIQLKLDIPTIRRGRARLDYLGGALVAVSAAIPMLWVTFAGSDYDWISWQSGAFLLAFLVAATLTVVVELRVEQPVIPLRVLGNPVAVLMIIASIGAGVAMFGSGVFLTQYFQLGAGQSPTAAGLMTIPLIVAQMLSATIGGQIVSRTGRCKPVMLVGSVLMLVGVGGLGTIDHSTPYALVAVFMALMGMGIGTLVQNVVLMVQNTVDVTEVGAASAAIAFFRSLGGAVGVSILGAFLTDRVAVNIRDGLDKIGLGTAGSAGGETNLDLDRLPAPVQEVVHHAYADAFGPLFLIAAIVAASSLIAILIVREGGLRTTVRMTSPGTPPSGTPTVTPDAASSATDVSGAHSGYAGTDTDTDTDGGEGGAHVEAGR